MTEQINSHLAVDLSPEITKQLATVKERFLSFLLDTFLWFIPPILVLMMALLYFLFGLDNVWVFVVSILIFFLSLILILALNIVLTYNRSQSLGKHLMNIQVYDLSIKKRISFWKYALLRKIVGKEVLPAIPFFGIFYAVIDIVFIFREDHRMVHDHLSDTVVLKLDKNKQRKKLFDFTALD